MTDAQEGHGHVPEDQFRLRLLLARADARLTIKQAANKCGLNQGSWAKWEAGATPHDKVAVARAVQRGLGVDSQWLAFGLGLRQPVPEGESGHSLVTTEYTSIPDQRRCSRPNVRPSKAATDVSTRRPVRLSGHSRDGAR